MEFIQELFGVVLGLMIQTILLPDQEMEKSVNFNLLFITS